MRCDVVRKHIMSEPIPGEGMQVNTDIEIWREATSYHTALSPAGPRDLARVSSPYGGTSFRQQSARYLNCFFIRIYRISADLILNLKMHQIFFRLKTVV